MTKTHMTMRIDPTLPDRIDALAGVVGGKSTSDSLRKLLDLGMRVAVEQVPEPSPRPEPVMSDRDAAAVFAYLRRAMSDQLDAFAQHRPVGAVAEAMEVGTELLVWAKDVAARHGTTVAELGSGAVPRPAPSTAAGV